MEEQSQTTDVAVSQAYRPLLAVLFCLFHPGLGFFILRDIRTGLFYLGLYLFNTLIFIAAILLGIPFIGVMLLCYFAGILGLRIVASIVAFKKARRINAITFSRAFKSILVSLASFLIPGLGHFIIYKRIAAVLYFVVFLVLEMFFYATDYITDTLNIAICILRVISCIDAYLLYCNCEKRIKAFAELLMCTISYYVIVMAVLIPIVCFVVQSYYIVSDCMAATICIEDRILVNKIYYQFHEPRQEEIVLVRAGRYIKEGNQFIKRVLAVGGQTVRFEHDGIFVDGQKVTFLPSDKLRYMDFKYACNSDFLVPSGAYFLIGDNIDISYDSRYFGPVEKSDIIGKATYLFWPFSERKVLK